METNRVESLQMNPNQNSNPSMQSIQLNKNYMPTAIIHFLLFLFQLAILIALSVTIPKGLEESKVYFYTIAAMVYIFFSGIGLLLALFFFLIIITNFANVGASAKCPWILIILITDAILFWPNGVLSGLCAYIELAAPANDTYSIKSGTYGSAAAFGTLSLGLYVTSVVLQIIKLSKRGESKSKIPSPSNN